MRADVVSTVTHELSTPLSTMLAVGDTLVRGRVTGPEAVGEYAQMLVQETTRLTRLVDMTIFWRTRASPTSPRGTPSSARCRLT